MDNQQSAESVDKTHRGQGEEGLSPEEEAVKLRGQEYRRHLLAAAALHDIYTMGELAEAVGVSPGTVQGWWRGAQPQATTIPKIARALDFTTEALFSWFHEGGPPPRLYDPDAERAEGEALGREAERALRPAADTGSRATPRAPHGSAGSAR